MSNTRPNLPLGNIEAAINGHYDKLGAGSIEGFGAVITPAPAPAQAAVPVPAVEKPFIHLEYTVNENGHRDFELQSTGVATDIEGIIAELEHTLSHLRAEVAGSAESTDAEEAPAGE